MTSSAGDVIRALILAKRAELDTLERALFIVDGSATPTAIILGPSVIDAAPEKPTRKATPRAAAEPTPDAALQADVLAVLEKGRGPMRGRDVIAKLTQHRPDHVILTLRALSARHEVIKSGGTSSLRYCSPRFTPDAAE
jgi:hypothetical protein